MALLAFIWPCGCAFRQFIIPLFAMFGHFWAKRISARINSTWQQLYFAFWPHPLTLIFICPCGHALSPQNWFLIGLMMNVDFYFSSAPSQQNRISIHLTANVNFYFYSTSLGRYFILTSQWYARLNHGDRNPPVTALVPPRHCTTAYTRITKTIGWFCQMRVC